METDFILSAILLSGLAGLAATLGAIIGWLNKERIEFISAPLRHGIIAFGGGALIGAIGLVLVPHGVESQPLWLATATFLIGGLVFMGLSWWLKKRNTPIGQLLALMLDFVPEAIVLGAVISMEFEQAVFLAVIIGAQNLPEGFNAFRDMQMGSKKAGKLAVPLMALSPFVGMAAAMLGLFVYESNDLSLGMITTFCAGGILYLVFEDIIPESHDEDCGLFPAYGGLLGFAVGLIGYGLVG
jgi:ZIP family zinc transporter